ncbi:hypothetical protein KKD61_05215 [Patescibacteria group bacterium]|nr:hypothetical protein [Patescibacteria group bacterium]
MSISSEMLEKGSEPESAEALKKVTRFLEMVSGKGELPPRLVGVSELPLEEIKTLLKESGANLRIGEAEATSLRHTQFRELDQGKGPGVVAVFGPERAEEYLRWAAEASKEAGMPRLHYRDKPVLESADRSRGLMHFLAWNAAVVTGVKSPEEVIVELNQRAYNGHRAKNTLPPEKLAIMFPEMKRVTTMASFPPGILPEAFAKIIESGER